MYSVDMDDEAIQRYQLKKKLEVLQSKKGFHTELVSLYIPPRKSISDITTHLKNEISESSNIKSKLTRQNVIDSITSLLGQLNKLSEIPDKGLVMFSGAIPENMAGTEKNELYMLIPPDPVPFFKYYCASEFWLEPLYDMIEAKDVFGIIQIDNKEAAVAWMKGSHLEVVKTMTSGLHSKHKAGGQSQRRFERLIEQGAQEFYKRVAEIANRTFISDDFEVRGIFIAGAGMSKNSFAETKELDNRLQDKIIDIVDVGYAGAEGIRETIQKIEDQIEDLELIREKKAYDRFMKEFSKDTGLVAYGEKEIRRAFSMGAIELLLVNRELESTRVAATCAECEHQVDKTIKNDDLEDFYSEFERSPCPQCGSMQWSFKKLDLIEDLIERARETSAGVQLMSEETEWGVSLLRTFGGLAAVLRYRIDY